MSAIAPPRRLLDVQTIYFEPAVLEYERGREILATHPDAERIEVPSHWQFRGRTATPATPSTG